MAATIEFIMRIIFVILIFIWAGKILIFRTDKQVVVNPVLLVISAILAILPSAGIGATFFGISVIHLRIILYSISSIIIVRALYSMRKRNAIF
ncbi:hypothetical protein EXD82_05005 [Peptacetobacter hominis]|uniref:Uncharacterized protein n=1 Tax=Peptacetobacter hominis TaxID=2743610 RepID=A0A544QVU0_9FIRM|nr:hypothetical protein EXD82_05005 [Peptacetobacter hominis]